MHQGWPIPMLLFCPRCSMQHVDKADPESGWSNPPHATHTCAYCSLLWRPSNANTVGVAMLPVLEERHLERINAAFPQAHLPGFVKNAAPQPSTAGIAAGLSHESLGQGDAAAAAEHALNMRLVERAAELVGRVEFNGYRFSVRLGHGGVLLRAAYMDADVYTGKQEEQLTRNWTLHPAMTDSEIVQTAFKCAYTSFEHRCRESFLYKGRRIFGPHFDVEDLWNLCERRENAGGRNATVPARQP